MALFHHNSERLEVTEGGYTSRIDGYDIIYWKGTAHVNIFLQVFDLSLWLAIIVCTTILALYFFAESMIHQKEDSKSIQIIEAVVANSKMIVAMDVNEKKHHKKYSMRIILLAAGILGGVIMWTYSGVLVSFFSMELETKPFSSFQDLQAKPDLWLMILDGSSFEQVLISAIENDPSLNGVIEQNIIEMDSNAELMRNFLESDDKTNDMIFTASDSLFMYIEKNPEFSFQIMCEIKIGQLDGLGGKIKSGWLYPKNSILKPIFDKHLIKLSQSGVEKRLQNIFFNFKDNLNCQSDYQEVGMNIATFLFQLLGAGLVIALMIFVIESLFAWKIRKSVKQSSRSSNSKHEVF